ncbi:GNAT family N-acetyltransferase [Tepidimonas charontis]|uniref:Acetyltransferase (GNAT) domain protein n=1 Tax=Tepidimonas charontis TaxID=2267262 RepID=A0A554XCF8_9BURK|nr:GNAT family N-acetyltransferase [Tepidimonas charontis]TSE33469.1 Acetyltransferase (GNAT) domain protein [Tepidimonas charontis]
MSTSTLALQPVIRSIHDRDIGAVCALFTRVFGQAMTPEVWRWKYHGSALLGSANVVAVDRGGDIVGHAGAQVFSGRAGAQPLRMIHVCDVMAATAVRGDWGRHNINRRLIEALAHDVVGLGPRAWPTFAYGFAGQRQIRLGQRLGFYAALYGCAQVSWCAPAQTIRRWRTAAGWWAQCVPWSRIARDAQLARRLADVRPIGIAPAPDKGPAYLLWRYAQHPRITYQLWILRRAPWVVGGWLVSTTGAQHPMVVDGAMAAGGPTLEQALTALSIASGMRTWDVWPRAFGAQSTLPAATEPMVAARVVPACTWADDAPPHFHPGDTDVY